MPTTVTMPDGVTVDFPDSMSHQDIEDVLSGKVHPPAAPATHERTWGEFLSGANRAFQHGAASGASFGLTDRALTPEEKAADTEHPIASTLGQIGGGLASGQTELKVLSLIPGIGKLITPVAGQGVRNAAKVVGTGALLGGEQAAGSGGDIAQGAVQGGLAAGVAAPVGAGIVNAGRWLGALGSNSLRVNNAIRIIAQRLKMTPAQAAQKLDQLEADTGRQLTTSEVLDIRSGAEFQKLAEHKDVVGDAFRANEERVLAERPGSMQSQITQGGVGTVAQLDAARKAEFDTGMAAIERSTAAIPPNAPPELRKRIASLADDLSRRGDPTAQTLLQNDEVSLRTLDTIRQDLAAKADAAPGEGYDRLRNYTEMLANRANPKYGGLLDAFGARSRQIKGIEAGQSNKDVGNLKGPERQDAGTMEYIVGREGGTRNRLSDAAGSERGAVTVADQLRQLPQRVEEALGTPEASRLQRLGSAETQTAERLKQLSTTPEAPSNKTERAAQVLTEGVAVMGGNVMRGFAVHWIRRMRLAVADGLITPKTAAEVARLMTDPGSTRQAIQKLRDVGVSDAKIAGWVRAVAQSVGQDAGGAQ